MTDSIHSSTRPVANQNGHSQPDMAVGGVSDDRTERPFPSHGPEPGDEREGSTCDSDSSAEKRTAEVVHSDG